MSPQHVIILGAGAIGVSTAVHLLRTGAQVTLVTDADVASGASGRSLSWLNSAGARSRPYHDLRMAGIDRYRTLFAAQPNLEWLRFDGGLYWGVEGSAEETRERHSFERGHAYDSHLVDADSIDAHTTNINAEAITETGIFNPGEGWVSLPHLIDFLLREFTERGGLLHTGAGRCSVITEASRAVGVRTGAGDELRGDAVLVACGPQTPQVVAELGVTIPDASPVSMLVTTEKLESANRAVLNTPRAAVRPNPGNTVAVDHDWYEQSIHGSDEEGYSIDESVITELLGEASKLLDGTPELEVGSYKIGRKPIPGDGEPVFGQLQEVSGCYVAFTHSGATLALVAGELLAYEISTGRTSPMLETFRPERFA